MSELACTKCMWTGKKEDARVAHIRPEWICPECDGPAEIIEHEFLPYEQSYNWNKK